MQLAVVRAIVIISTYASPGGKAKRCKQNLSSERQLFANLSDTSVFFTCPEGRVYDFSCYKERFPRTFVEVRTFFYAFTHSTQINRLTFLPSLFNFHMSVILLDVLVSIASNCGKFMEN